MLYHVLGVTHKSTAVGLARVAFDLPAAVSKLKEFVWLTILQVLRA